MQQSVEDEMMWILQAQGPMNQLLVTPQLPQLSVRSPQMQHFIISISVLNSWAEVFFPLKLQTSADALAGHCNFDKVYDR